MLPTRLPVILIFFVTASLAKAQSSRPIQVLNFDFGDGPAYTGDDGVLSSPGGTHWNRIPADFINSDFPFSGPPPGSPTLRDEFGRQTDGIMFSRDSDAWADSSFVALGPLSDAIAPAASGGTTLTLGRVNRFEELIIYFASPFPLTSNSIVGFSGDQNSTLVVEPFQPLFSQPPAFFPGLEGQTYLRFTESPPIGVGLGESPTITIVIPETAPAIAAIQIRGRFRGLPEPASIALLGLGLSAGALHRRRTLSAIGNA